MADEQGKHRSTYGYDPIEEGELAEEPLELIHVDLPNSGGSTDRKSDTPALRRQWHRRRPASEPPKEKP